MLFENSAVDRRISKKYKFGILIFSLTDAWYFWRNWKLLRISRISRMQWVFLIKHLLTCICVIVWRTIVIRKWYGIRAFHPHLEQEVSRTLLRGDHSRKETGLLHTCHNHKHFLYYNLFWGGCELRPLPISVEQRSGLRISAWLKFSISPRLQ